MVPRPLQRSAPVRRLGVAEGIVIDERKTIRNLGDRWLTWKKQECTTEFKAHRDAGRLLRKWVYPHPIAAVDLENDLDLDFGICTDWVEWVKKAGRAPNTARNIVQGLRGFLVDVRGKGWVKLRENPLLDRTSGRCSGRRTPSPARTPSSI